MTRTGLPQRHPDAAYKLVDGEALIVVPGSDATHVVLNETGARIWELLDGTRDLDSISASIAEEFEAEPAQARRDLEDLLAELREHGAMADSATGGAES